MIKQSKKKNKIKLVLFLRSRKKNYEGEKCRDRNLKDNRIFHQDDGHCANEPNLTKKR